MYMLALKPARTFYQGTPWSVIMTFPSCLTGFQLGGIYASWKVCSSLWRRVAGSLFSVDKLPAENSPTLHLLMKHCWLADHQLARNSTLPKWSWENVINDQMFIWWSILYKNRWGMWCAWYLTDVPAGRCDMVAGRCAMLAGRCESILVESYASSQHYRNLCLTRRLVPRSWVWFPMCKCFCWKKDNWLEVPFQSLVGW